MIAVIFWIYSFFFFQFKQFRPIHSWTRVSLKAKYDDEERGERGEWWSEGDERSEGEKVITLTVSNLDETFWQQEVLFLHKSWLCLNHCSCFVPHRAHLSGHTNIVVPQPRETKVSNLAWITKPIERASWLSRHGRFPGEVNQIETKRSKTKSTPKGSSLSGGGSFGSNVEQKQIEKTVFLKERNCIHLTKGCLRY